jgi:hypothetical protein
MSMVLQLTCALCLESFSREQAQIGDWIPTLRYSRIYTLLVQQRASKSLRTSETTLPHLEQATCAFDARAVHVL